MTSWPPCKVVLHLGFFFTIRNKICGCARGNSCTADSRDLSKVTVFAWHILVCVLAHLDSLMQANPAERSSFDMQVFRENSSSEPSVGCALLCACWITFVTVLIAQFYTTLHLIHIVFEAALIIFFVFWYWRKISKIKKKGMTITRRKQPSLSFDETGSTSSFLWDKKIMDPTMKLLELHQKMYFLSRSNK